VSVLAHLRRKVSYILRRLQYESKETILSKRPDLSHYDIGRWSYGDLRVLRYRVNGNLKVGSFCSFADNVAVLLGGDHNPNNLSTYPFGVFLGGVSESAHASTKGDVVIGNDVWVGRNATILPGVKIGDGAVIGAHSVIARDIPPYAIAVGNPGKVVRARFQQDVIDELLRVRWWDWPDDEIRRAAPHLLSNDIEAFFRFARTRSHA